MASSEDACTKSDTRLINDDDLNSAKAGLDFSVGAALGPKVLGS